MPSAAAPALAASHGPPHPTDVHVRPRRCVPGHHLRDLIQPWDSTPPRLPAPLLGPKQCSEGGLPRKNPEVSPQPSPARFPRPQQGPQQGRHSPQPRGSGHQPTRHAYCPLSRSESEHLPPGAPPHPCPTAHVQPAQGPSTAFPFPGPLPRPPRPHPTISAWPREAPGTRARRASGLLQSARWTPSAPLHRRSFRLDSYVTPGSLHGHLAPTVQTSEQTPLLRRCSSSPATFLPEASLSEIILFIPPSPRRDRRPQGQDSLVLCVCCSRHRQPRENTKIT